MGEPIRQMLEGIEQMPNVVRNPFSLKCITSISTWAGPSIWSKDKGKWEYSATVRFKNGDTKGEQKIKGDNFIDLFTKIAAFCNSI